MSKMSVEAVDKKFGMSLAELKRAVEKFSSIAEINESDTSQSKVSILINFSGGIKEITAEV
jgi:hypothetical protein